MDSVHHYLAQATIPCSVFLPLLDAMSIEHTARTSGLDISIPSVRNLRRISSSRIALWWLLAISTIPLHLFYNSAVFASLYSRDYNVWVVPVDFLDGIPFSYYNEYGIWPNTNKGQHPQLQRNAATLQQLDNRACLKAYLGSINSNRGDVI